MLLAASSVRAAASARLSEPSAAGAAGPSDVVDGQDGQAADWDARAAHCAVRMERFARPLRRRRAVLLHSAAVPLRAYACLTAVPVQAACFAARAEADAVAVLGLPPAAVLEPLSSALETACRTARRLRSIPHFCIHGVCNSAEQLT